ncbi:MAG: Bug family tripartite tricarboxylate transporter substrate binding protein [Burkholderiales bacterium]
MQPRINMKMSETMRAAASIALVLAASYGWEPVHAQPYPTQPIRLIVPWPPGGGVDTSARIIAQPLSQRLGQNIVIENRPGAGGNIGTELAARAKPDGYSLLMVSVSPNAINVHLYPKLASSSWYGLMAPAGTPRPMIQRINDELNAIMKTPEMAKRLAEFGGDLGGGTPEAFGAFVAAEIKRYADVVKASGAKLE